MIEFNVIFILLFLGVIVKLLVMKNRGNVVCINDFNVQNTLPVRGILALSIIVHHLSIFGYGCGSFLPFYSWGVYIVSVFFFLTGYGLMVSYIKKGQSYLKGFISHRFFKLLPPYLLCVALYVVYQYMTIDDFSILSVLTKDIDKAVNILLPTSWFVVVILIFYLAFYLSMKLGKSLPVNIIILVGWAVCYYFAVKYLNLKEYWYMSIFALNLGMVFAYKENILKRYINQHLVESEVVALLLFLIVYVFIPYIDDSIVPLHLGYKYKLFGVTIIPLFVVLLTYGGRIHSKWLDALGKKSYEIYLVQGFICQLYYGYLYSSPLLYFVSAIGMSVVMAYVVSTICDSLYSKTRLS